MRKFFIAAPLFNQMETERNTRIAESIRDLGEGVFLPQDELGVLYERENPQGTNAARKEIFEGDLKGVRSCDVFVLLLDGRVPDEGACVELGVAFELGKLCVGLKTDERAMDKLGMDNIMIEQALSQIFKSEVDLFEFIKSTQG